MKILIISFLCFSLFFSNVSSVSYEFCNNVTVSQIKYCNFRDDLYPEELFRFVAGAYCYNYTGDSRLKNRTRLKLKGNRIPYPDGQQYILPYAVDPETKKSFFFDYENKDFVPFIENAFATKSFYGLWLTCAKQADVCCKYMTNNQVCPNDQFSCPKVWDAWDCWPQAKNNTISKRDCVIYAHSSDPPCIMHSEKECLDTGHWKKKTNYDICSFTDIILNRHIFHVQALEVATAFCIPAIIILLIYPSLRITRVILHRNLIIAILLKNIFVIMSKSLLTIYTIETKSNIRLEENSAACRTLAFFERLSVNAMYSMMLIDGYYLHKAIVRVFKKEPNLYILHGIAAVISMVPVLAWAIVKAVQDNNYCWIVDESGWIHWIIDGSRYAILGLNVLFLIDILRVFFSRFKDMLKNSSEQTKVTLKATIVLLPLFLIQFAMMSQRPENISCDWDSVFYYFSYTMDALQGIIVTLLYCYLNREVQNLLRRSYNKLKFRYQRRQTINTRKNTAATYVRESTIEDRDRIGELVDTEDNALTKVQNWFNKKFRDTNEAKSTETPTN